MNELRHNLQRAGRSRWAPFQLFCFDVSRAFLLTVHTELVHERQPGERDDHRATNHDESPHAITTHAHPRQTERVRVGRGDQGERLPDALELGGVDGLVHGVGGAGEVATLVAREDSAGDVEPAHKEEHAVQRFEGEEALQECFRLHDFLLRLADGLRQPALR